MSDTVEELEVQLSWLKKQVARTKERIAKLKAERKPLRPAQRDLAGMPAAEPKRRMQTVHEIFYESFQAHRTEKLGPNFTPDEPVHPAYINVALKKMRAACESDDEQVTLLLEFFKNDHWAKKEIPYPFGAFAAPTVWEKLLRSIREGRTLP